MFIAEMFEPRSYVTEDSQRIVVTYPGRFQPFHLGHAAVYKKLQNDFGTDNVFIATSNDTSSEKSPFNFNDKIAFMTAAGVPAGRIIEVTKPYDLPDAFTPAGTVFIAAVGAHDASRLGIDSTLKRDNAKTGKRAGDPSYFKSWRGMDGTVTADQHGYVVTVPEIHKAISINGQQFDVSHGTQARAAWNDVRNDEQGRAEYLMQMYGRNDPELGRILDKIPTGPAPVKEPKPSPALKKVKAPKAKPADDQEVNEDAGGVGVVADKSQAKDPRYSMSLTQDVRPGETDRQLRKMHLKDSRILNHPTPTVEEIAKKHGVKVEYVEQQLEQGMRVESEHTRIKAAAREIALDHLNERPDYYVRLKKVER